MGSILSGGLSRSSGLGGGNTSGYPADSTMVPNPGTGAPLVQAGRQGVSDVTQGKITLAALGVLVLGVAGFYIVTHKIQGGG